MDVIFFLFLRGLETTRHRIHPFAFGSSVLEPELYVLLL